MIWLDGAQHPRRLRKRKLVQNRLRKPLKRKSGLVRPNGHDITT